MSEEARLRGALSAAADELEAAARLFERMLKVHKLRKSYPNKAVDTEMIAAAFKEYTEAARAARVAAEMRL